MAMMADKGYTRDELREQLKVIHASDAGTYRIDFDEYVIDRQMKMEQVAQRDVTNNQVVVDNLLGGFLSEEITTTRGMIEEAFLDGDITSQTALDMQAKLKVQQGIRDNDPRTKRVYAESAAQLKSNLGGFLPTALSEQAFLSARLALRQGVDTWLENNPTLDETAEEFEKWLNPFILRLQKKHIPTARIVQGQQAATQEGFLVKAFKTEDFGLSEEELISLYAENTLIADGSVNYEGTNAYYDFLLEDGRGLSEWDAGNFNIGRKAILGQLRLKKIDITDRDFLKALQARRDQLLAEATMRSGRASQRAVTDSPTRQASQAASMGLTPEESDTIVQQRQDTLTTLLQ